MKYRIMTFDGGGIRGVLTVRLLQRINKISPGIFKNANIYAGTSTGSLIACALALEKGLDELEKLYSVDICRQIFRPSSPGIIAPRYNINKLKEFISRIIPTEIRLSDLENKVILTAFRISETESDSGWCPVFFNNLPDSNNSSIKVVDALLASCAAPIYFSSYNNFIDGGVVANNPAAVALSFALGMLCGRHNLPAIRLFSIGTGYSPNKISYNTSNWGALQWLLCAEPPVPLISLLLDGAARADDMITGQLLGNNYHRLNPLLSKSISLDHFSSIDYLKKYADDVDINPTLKWLRYTW